MTTVWSHLYVESKKEKKKKVELWETEKMVVSRVGKWANVGQILQAFGYKFQASNHLQKEKEMSLSDLQGPS